MLQESCPKITKGGTLIFTASYICDICEKNIPKPSVTASLAFELVTLAKDHLSITLVLETSRSG
jgi:hypothetical protein